MAWNKNDEVIIEITDMGMDGNGIGHTEDGYTLFVKDTVIGDRVKVKVMKAKKNYGFARLTEVISPSEHRVEAVCPVARQCGGCQLMNMSYERQKQYKEDKILNCLTRIGGFDEAFLKERKDSFLGMEFPYFYRNKALFPVGMGKDGKCSIGFYAGRTHSIVATDGCYLQGPVNGLQTAGQSLGKEAGSQRSSDFSDLKVSEEIPGKILAIIRDYVDEHHVAVYDETTGKGLLRHILIRSGFATGEWMACLVVNGKKLPKEELLVEKLTSIPGMKSIGINTNTENTNVVMGKETRFLWGDEFISDDIGAVKFRISPVSFYQVNPVQTNHLYQAALDYAGLKGDETVWDLYCGIGTISLFLAQKAGHVYGVEINPKAIEDAKKNACLNGMENVTFYAGAAEDFVPSAYEKNPEAKEAKASGGEALLPTPDVIVVDPPRKGCDSVLIETLLKAAPKKIVYVSCDPATLARDLKLLCEGGYQMECFRGCDMFPMSGHVETVVLMSKVK